MRIRTGVQTCALPILPFWQLSRQRLRRNEKGLGADSEKFGGIGGGVGVQRQGVVPRGSSVRLGIDMRWNRGFDRIQRLIEKIKGLVQYLLPICGAKIRMCRKSRHRSEERRVGKEGVSTRK